MFLYSLQTAFICLRLMVTAQFRSELYNFRARPFALPASGRIRKKHICTSAHFWTGTLL